MTTLPPARRAPRGFTLIELLVVIAIIALLAAILFPVFAQAREKARQTTCASNLRQLGLAFLQYSNDNDESYPGAYYISYYDTRGNNPLEVYIKNHSGYSGATVWKCPDLAKFYEGGDTGDTYYKYPRSYSMNEFLVTPGPIQDTHAPGSVPQTIADPDSCYPTASATKASDEPLYWDDAAFTTTRLSNPAQTDLLFESITQDGSTTGTGSKYTGRPPSGLGSWKMVKGYWVKNGNVSDAARATTFTGHAMQSPDQTYHTKMNNYLFCDGHVKARIPETEGYDITQHPQDNIWLVSDGRNGDAVSTSGCH